jgi:hypothetical protein
MPSPVKRGVGEYRDIAAFTLTSSRRPEGTRPTAVGEGSAVMNRGERPSPFIRGLRHALRHWELSDAGRQQRGTAPVRVMHHSIVR